MNYNIRRMIFLIIALIWAIVIFAFSAKPGDESENQSIKVGMTVCNIFVPGFDNLQEYEQVDMAKKIDYPVRKTAHATEYAILAGCVLGAVSTNCYLVYNESTDTRFYQVEEWINCNMYGGNICSNR